MYLLWGTAWISSCFYIVPFILLRNHTVLFDYRLSDSHIDLTPLFSVFLNYYEHTDQFYRSFILGLAYKDNSNHAFFSNFDIIVRVKQLGWLYLHHMSNIWNLHQLLPFFNLIWVRNTVLLDHIQYAVFIILLILLELGGAAFIFFNKDWEDVRLKELFPFLMHSKSFV